MLEANKVDHAEERPMNRTLFGAIAVAVLAGTAASAQDYPTRLIKLTQGFPPGGNIDITARLLGNEMSKSLGQPIVVESRPGVVGSACSRVCRAQRSGWILALGRCQAHIPRYGALA